MQEQQKVIAVVGPTASGKTNIAITLAEEFDGEVISADSRQVYRGLDVGTDKIMPDEMRGITHHCIDVADPAETFTAADFKDCNDHALHRIVTNHRIPIVAGGTGFWVDAALGRVVLPNVPPHPELRERLERIPADELYVQLEKRAPKRAETIEPDNKRRLIRAHEILDALGYIPEPTNATASSYDICWVGLDRSDTELTNRIQARARAQIDGGLLDEVASLEQLRISDDRWREFGFEYTIGRELARGTISHETAVERLTQKNFQYAKRQRKYLRRNANIEWFHPDDIETIRTHVRSWYA